MRPGWASADETLGHLLPGRCVLMSLRSVLYVLLVVWACGALLAALAGWVWAACWVSGWLLVAWLFERWQRARLFAWLGPSPFPGKRRTWAELRRLIERRIQAEQSKARELAISLRRYGEVGIAFPDGMAVLDANNALEWINPAAEEHLGLEHARDRGSAVCNLIREPGFADYLAGDLFETPLQLHSSRHPGRIYSLRIVPFGSSRKLLVSRDITQYKRLEAIRTDFVANISHELKTPLTVVSGFLETLQDALRELPPEEALRYVELARDQALRMERLVNDLLTLSKLESGQPLWHEEWLSVRDLIAEVVDDIRAMSRGRHTIEMRVSGNPLILGARDELRSALTNLGSNAVRYTPDGGRIVFAFDGEHLSVEDNGIGIAAQHVPRLSERFYRVDRGRSRESGGTGLGLAIVKHVMERHQGWLAIKSELARGSCFCLHLPPERMRSGQAPVPERAD